MASPGLQFGAAGRERRRLRRLWIAAPPTRGRRSCAPTACKITRPAFHGYYDGHKDTFLNTDVSDKTQAAEMHINYSAVLKAVPMSATSEIYLVQGNAAAGQIPVFGSEPGEASYTPLWHEMMVTWKAGVTPVLLVKDDQIKALAGKGQLTMTPTHIILNCPIVHPTKSALSGH